MSTNAGCIVIALPFDVLLELVNHLSGADMSNFLSTCKGLHRHLRDESIWHRLCAHYGLRSFTHFRVSSFYVLYTGLLHTYGPLLGLWANDHPFRGNIIEFSLFPGDESDSGGIVGEVWRISDLSSDDERPLLPQYERFLKITFDLPPSLAEYLNPAKLEQAFPICYPNSDIDSDLIDQHLYHLVSIQVIPPSRRGQFLRKYRHTHLHPEFPSPEAPWLDRERGYPRLKMSPLEFDDQKRLVSILPAARLPVMFTSTTSHLKPPSIRFYYSPYPSAEPPHTRYHKPHVPIPLMDTSPVHYYPLRCDATQRVSPDSEEWHISMLTGLWLGYFGQYGTECVYFAWDKGLRRLQAWKITGDYNVPRGVISWEAHAALEEMHGASHLIQDPRLARARRFIGFGTVGDQGFT
ncbi:hypothetical protein CERSUDRAFT_94646 [Gelatoporia subvermispora B]|uniref:F-box domain-containing protein n=1 Tax=Ceriporiopsis subvermispora (strain B) TaxID=914234 RepID=M2PML5_CERS8|nr:hypothetical protein CERSUDRAFT_94646 [Gelatoporia subvermispora B]